MKFNLTITDMTEDEFSNIYKAIHLPSGNNVVSNSDTPVVEEADFEQPAPFEPAYDKDGLPWDARIHSSNHKVNADGRWQRRRGVSDVEFEKIKAELLGIVVPEPVAPVVAPVVTPEPLEATPAPVAPIAPEPIIYTPTPTPEPIPAVDADTLWKTMFQKLQLGLANQSLKPNDIQNIVNSINVTFGTSYTTLAAVKGNVDGLQFAINELVTRGL